LARSLTWYMIVLMPSVIVRSFRCSLRRRGFVPHYYNDGCRRRKVTVDENDWLAGRFEEHRARLRAVAYRMLGSLCEADDAVQEAWLGFGRSDTGGVENLGGWRTKVVAWVCAGRGVLHVRSTWYPQPSGPNETGCLMARRYAGRCAKTPTVTRSPKNGEGRETAPSKDRDLGLRRRLLRSDHRIEERARGPGTSAQLITAPGCGPSTRRCDSVGERRPPDRLASPGAPPPRPRLAPERRPRA